MSSTRVIKNNLTLFKVEPFRNKRISFFYVVSILSLHRNKLVVIFNLI